MKSLRMISYALFFICSKTYALDVKVAVLDNLQFQKMASEKYENCYFTGLNLANSYGKKKKINLVIKHFEYGKGDLDILSKAEEVKSWNPDIVIGPRSSGKFLMLKKTFKDVMVISPLASSNDISKMESNFYSITPSNKDSAKKMSSFVVSKLNKRNIFSITELDCKSCVDYSYSILSNKSLKIKNRNLLSSEIESLDGASISEGIKDGDLILLSATSYGSALILSKISSHYPKKTLTFLGTDEWGSFKSSYVGKIKVVGNFTGYRIVPWSLNVHSNNIKNYYKELAMSGRPENDEISFVMYSLGKSIVDMVSLYKAKNISIKEILLKGYISEIKKNPIYLKPAKYAVFIRTKDNEKFEMEF